MVASKGGITYDRAGQFTPSHARMIGLALAVAHGSEIDYDKGRPVPPASVTDSLKKPGGLHFSE